MSEEATLVQKFSVFFNEVLPLFGHKDVNQAEADLAEPKNIHTFLYFLQSPDNRALIVNVKTGDNGLKRFYFYLNPRDVGNVESGFTLIKKADFDINRRFKHVFHALSLEPFLVTRIDALLFDELLQTMAPKLTTVHELEPIFTFGQDEPILDSRKVSAQSNGKVEASPSQSDKYISIQEPEDSIYRGSDKGGSPTKSSPSPRPAPKPEAKPPIFSKNGKFANRLNSKEGIEEEEAQLKYKPQIDKKPGERSTPTRKQEPEVSSPTKRAPSPMRKSIGGSITKLNERASTPKKSVGGADSPTKIEATGKNPSARALIDSPTEPTRKPSEGTGSARGNGLRNSQIYSSTSKDEQSQSFGGPTGTSAYQSQSGPTGAKKKKKQIYVLESLDAAREGIRQNKAYVAELATYHVPTRTMELVMQAVILLTSGKKLPWPKLKLEVKKPTWLKEVLDLGTNDVDPSVVNEIMHNYLIDDDWEATGPGANKSGSKTKAFAEWVETFCCEVKKEQAAHGVE